MISSKNKNSPKSSKHSTTSKSSTILTHGKNSKETKVPKNTETTTTTLNVNDPDMETLLKERRAVSESRFRLMEQDKENRATPIYNLIIQVAFCFM